MKAKRIFAILLAILLIKSAFPMVVSVAAPDTEVHGGNGSVLVPNISYTQIREATLPTSVPFTFTIDTQGVLNLTAAQVAALVVEPGGTRLGEIVVITPCSNTGCEDHHGGSTACNEVTGWKLLDTAGQIIFPDYAPFFINNSNYDVALEIEFSFDAGTTGVVLVGTPEAAVTGTARNLFIGAMFSSDNVNTTPTNFSGELTLPILAAERKPMFLLSAAEYNNETTVTRLPDEPDGVIQSIVVEQRKNKAAGDTGHGTQLTLAGVCNPHADWSGFDENQLSFNITFRLSIPTVTTWSFTAPSQFVFPGTPIPGAYALVEGNGLTAADFITWTRPVFDPIAPPVTPPAGAVGFFGTGGPAGLTITNETTASLNTRNAGAAGSTIFIPFTGATTANTVILLGSGNPINAAGFTVLPTGIEFSASRSDTMRNISVPTTYTIIIGGVNHRLALNLS